LRSHQRHAKGAWISFTTEDLASLDQRHSDAKSEICLMSARILEGLVDTLRQYIPVFLTVSDCISLIDCLRSFAEHISTSPLDSFRRPVFNHSGSLAIKEGRHPLRWLQAARLFHSHIFTQELRMVGGIGRVDCFSSIFSPDFFVANNTLLSPSAPFSLLSGPNMSGKSIYLRQVDFIHSAG
jgi:DNA mismatch repair protein MSH4